MSAAVRVDFPHSPAATAPSPEPAGRKGVVPLAGLGTSESEAGGATAPPRRIQRVVHATREGGHVAVNYPADVVRAVSSRHHHGRVTLTYARREASTESVPIWVALPDEPHDSAPDFEYPDPGGAERHLSWSEAFARLDELGSLSHDWDSYGADPISRRAVDRAREIMVTLRFSFPPPLFARSMPSNIAPIADGGIQLEWYKEGLYLEIELTGEGQIAYFLREGEGSQRRSSSGDDLSTPEVITLVRKYLDDVGSCWNCW